MGAGLRPERKRRTSHRTLKLARQSSTLLERLNGAITMWAFWIGIIKAPIFGFLIALI